MKVEPIAALVAAMAGISKTEMLGLCRKHARPRQLAMWLAIKMGAGFSATGRYFKRDHTTAMYSYRRVEMARLREPSLYEFTNRLLALLTECNPSDVAARAMEFRTAVEELPTVARPPADYVPFYSDDACDEVKGREKLVAQNSRFAEAFRAAQMRGEP